MDIKVGGKIDPTVTGYSVQEETTPLVAGNESGAIAQVSADAESKASEWLSAKQTLEVYDELHGEMHSVIRTTAVNDGGVALTADSRMYALLQERLADGYRGTLGGAFDYYLSLVGITVGTSVHPNLAARPVIFPAWEGEVWVYLKKLCVAQGVEIALVNNVITLREPRTKRITSNLATGFSTTTDVTALAESVEVYNYNTEYKVKGLVYPPGQMNSESGATSVAGGGSSAPLITIPYGEVITMEVEIDAFLETIQQPVCVKTVPVHDNQDITSSMYSITYQGEDAKGEQITKTMPPDTWARYGGYVKVTKKPDTLNTLIIELSAGNLPRGFGPLELSIVRDDTTFNTLFIVGKGIFTRKEKITVDTGVGAEDAASVVGETIDNEFIGTRTLAYELMYDVIGQYCGLTMTLSGSAPLLALENKEFATFGETAGARYRNDYAEFRLTSADISPDGINFNAEYDTLMVDWNEAWGPDATLADVETYFAINDKNFLDIARAPLRTSE